MGLLPRILDHSNILNNRPMRLAGTDHAERNAVDMAREDLHFKKEIKMQIKLARKNSKMGGVPHLNLMPIKTCRKDVLCKEKCYCLKALRQYPESIGGCWANNTEMYKRNPIDFFAQLDLKLSRQRKPLFRWHAAGDIPDYFYLLQMVALAKKHRHIRFLAFTKQFDTIRRLGDTWAAAGLPPNLSIILSMWPGQEDPDIPGYRKAWMQDGTENRVPPRVFTCPGHCESCRYCWATNRFLDVVFKEH